MTLLSSLCLFFLALCAGTGHGISQHRAQLIAAARNRSDNELMLVLTNISSLNSQCKSFRCIENDFLLQLDRDPLRTVNLVEFTKFHFGATAARKFDLLFKKIHLNRPVVNFGQTEQQPTAFKSTGYILEYMGVGDASTKLETIFSVEPNAAGYFACGITFPKPQVIEQELSSTIIPSSSLSSNVSQHRRLLAPAVARPLFFSLMGILGGLSSIPNIAFLSNYSDVGIIAVKAYRLPEVLWENVKDTVNRRPPNTLKFTGILSNSPIQTGINILARAHFSGQCEQKDHACKFMKAFKKTGASVIVKFNPGYSSNKVQNFLTSRVLTISLGNKTISDRIVLRDMGIYAQVSFKGLTTGVVGTSIITVNEHKHLYFTASIGYSYDIQLPHIKDLRSMIGGAFGQTFKPWIPTGPSLGIPMKFAMRGFWEKAFGLPFVHFGNVLLSTKLHPATLLIKQFAVGAEAWLGTMPQSLASADSRFKATIYGAWHPTNPLQNYFIGHVSTITIQALVDTMQINSPSPMKLPEIFGDTGLYPLDGNLGILMSWALFDMQVPHTTPPVIIRQGFRAQGKLKFLDYEVKADIEVDHIMKTLMMYFSIDRIELLGGTLKLAHSRNNSKIGPHFMVNISLGEHDWDSSYLELNYTGYLSILGSSQEVSGKYDATGLHLHQDWKLFKLFTVDLSLTLNLHNHHTRIQGKFAHDGLIEGLQNSVKQYYINHLKDQHRRLVQEGIMPQNVSDALYSYLHHTRQGLGKVREDALALGVHIRKGEWIGALGSVGVVGLDAVQAFSLVAVTIREVSFDMELEKAKKHSFGVLVRVYVRVFDKEKEIVLPMKLNLEKPGEWAKQVRDEVANTIYFTLE